jgi:quercetin dioxygenase-like cupin family protein
LLRANNKLLIEKAKELATEAGYPGLRTARRFHEWARKAQLLEKIEESFGPVKHCWATVGEAGTPGIPEHTHNRSTVVYYPHDHSVGTWIDGEYYEATLGSAVMFGVGVPHHVEPNDTDETRVTIIFTLEKT